jgi:hypothetical protein
MQWEMCFSYQVYKLATWHDVIEDSFEFVACLFR